MISPTIQNNFESRLEVINTLYQYLYWFGIIKRVHEQTLLQREGARLIELAVCQIQRVMWRYRERGAASIVSECRGRPG